MKRIYQVGVALGVITAALAAAERAEAAGFALKEQSGSSLGQAYSNATSGTGDISYMFFNPATLAKAEGFNFVALGSYIGPKSEVSNAVGAFPNPQTSYGDIGEDAVLPAFYASAEVMDGLVLGLGVNAPFGLVTDYPTFWTGSPHAIRSDLSTITVNPAFGWQINDMFSIGAGLKFQYIEAELSQRTGASTTARLDGDDWGYGFNVGLLVEPSDDLTIGLGYQSRIDHTLGGDLTAFFNGTPVGALGAEADFTSPDMISLGFTYDIDEQWSVSAEAQYTLWSTFDDLTVTSSGVTVSTTREDWDDQIFLALGGEYRFDDKWTFRGGVAFDETPIPDSTRTPRVPGGNRYWLAIGASYEVNEWFGIDAGYTHIFVEDTEVRLNGSESTPSAGPLTADYDNGIDIVTLQARFSF
jgi:long-chain fatty acid transport protein